MRTSRAVRRRRRAFELIRRPEPGAGAADPRRLGQNGLLRRRRVTRALGSAKNQRASPRSRAAPAGPVFVVKGSQKGSQASLSVSVVRARRAQNGSRRHATHLRLPPRRRRGEPVAGSRGGEVARRPSEPRAARQRVSPRVRARACRGGAGIMRSRRRRGNEWPRRGDAAIRVTRRRRAAVMLFRGDAVCRGDAMSSRQRRSDVVSRRRRAAATPWVAATPCRDAMRRGDDVAATSCRGNAVSR